MRGSITPFVLAAGLAAALAMLVPAALRAQPAASPAAAAALPAAAPALVDTKLQSSPPAGFVAPAEPKAEDNNAQRAKSQPGNNAPLWRAVRESGTQPGYTSLPGAEMGVLVQPFVKFPGSSLTTAGEAWRQVRNRWIIPYGGALFLIVGAAVALFYWRRGPLGGHSPDTGRLIERFTYLERVAHWSVAISFVVLAVSGLVIAFGKFFLLPIVGATLFGWLTFALKTTHNFVGPFFAVALVVFVVTYLRDNIPRGEDFKWLAKAGGIFGSAEMPSPRFNGGEKLLFWLGVLLLGLTVVASGLVLDQLVPMVDATRGNMQVAHLVHAAASVLMMAMFIGHIYMGTIGVKGAYQGMRTGYVDEAWAKDHHGLWYDDIQAGRVPAQRTATTSAALGAARPQA